MELKNYQKLFNEAALKADEAATLLAGDTPDMAKAETLLKESDALKQRAELARKAEDTKTALGAPVRTAAFPTNGDGTAEDLSKVLYVERFGETKAAVKQVLKDLYGTDYEQKRVEQMAVFNRYIRDSRFVPTIKEESLLREVVLNPELVQVAIKQGLSVSYIKDTMNESVGSLGGYTVPVDVQTTLTKKIADESVIMPRARVINTQRDKIEIPVKTGGDKQYASDITGVWEDERPTPSFEANLTFGLDDIPVSRLMQLAYLTRDLIEDNAYDVVGELTNDFATAFALDIDNANLLGNGNARPFGIMPGGAPATGITTVNSGSASALTWDGIIGTRAAVRAKYRKNAVWIMSPSTVAEVMKLKSATSGDYFWQPFQYNGGGMAEPDRLLTHPVLEQQIMPDVAASAYPIIFGDIKGYTYVSRIGMTIERYLDGTLASQNKVMYLARMRVGGKVTEPWRFAVLKVST